MKPCVIHKTSCKERAKKQTANAANAEFDSMSLLKSWVSAESQEAALPWAAAEVAAKRAFSGGGHGGGADRKLLIFSFTLVRQATACIARKVFAQAQ